MTEFIYVVAEPGSRNPVVAVFRQNLDALGFVNRTPGGGYRYSIVPMKVVEPHDNEVPANQLSILNELSHGKS